MRLLGRGQVVGARELGQELSRDDLEGRAVLDLLQDDEEFVPADSCHEVARPEARTQAARDLDQDAVAGAVPVRVVHGLESIEIDEKGGEARGAPSRALYGLLERRAEAGPVGETRQGVAVGERSDVLPRESDLGRLAADPAVAEEAAVGRE